MGDFSTITSKGQITLPKDIRDRMGLLTGDKVLFTEVDGRIIVTPKNLNFNDLAGLLGDPPSGPLTLEEIDEGIATGLRRRFARSGTADREEFE